MAPLGGRSRLHCPCQADTALQRNPPSLSGEASSLSESLPADRLSVLHPVLCPMLSGPSGVLWVPIATGPVTGCVTWGNHGTSLGLHFPALVAAFPPAWLKEQVPDHASQTPGYHCSLSPSRFWDLEGDAVLLCKGRALVPSPPAQQLQIPRGGCPASTPRCFAPSRRSPACWLGDSPACPSPTKQCRRLPRPPSSRLRRDQRFPLRTLGSSSRALGSFPHS